MRISLNRAMTGVREGHHTGISGLPDEILYTILRSTARFTVGEWDCQLASSLPLVCKFAQKSCSCRVRTPHAAGKRKSAGSTEVLNMKEWHVQVGQSLAYLWSTERRSHLCQLLAGGFSSNRYHSCLPMDLLTWLAFGLSSLTAGGSCRSAGLYSTHSAPRCPTASTLGLRIAQR